MSDDKPKRKKYGQEHRDLAVRMAKLGATDTEIIASLGCRRTTFYVWLKNEIDFSNAFTEARRVSSDKSDLAKLAQRKQWAEDWLDNYLRTQGETLEESITSVQSDGSEKTVKRGKGKPPDMRLLDRILGVNPEPEEFVLKIELAEPEADDELQPDE